MTCVEISWIPMQFCHLISPILQANTSVAAHRQPHAQLPQLRDQPLPFLDLSLDGQDGPQWKRLQS